MTPALAALLLTLTSTGTLSSETYRSAVIVGVNESFEADQPTLEYADDDAARYYEMFAPLFDRVELLTVLDDDSQDVFPAAAQVARSPDAATLRDTIDRLDDAAAVARVAGRRTELYFVYVGHGRVEGGEGEVKLLGGALDRTNLTALVLDKRTHDRTHVIIDACNAYHLVNARGETEARGGRVSKDFDDAFEKFVESQTVDSFPTVGVVLSTSGAGQTLEWSRLRGGVFSYEVRSALTGAADADEDGRLDYTEVEAFLASANTEVPELKGRPKVFVRPPKIDRRAALLAHDGTLPAIELPPELDGHYVIEDDRGVRYAELNKALGYKVALRLVPRARYALLTRDGGELWRVEAPTGVVRPPMPLGDVVRPALERGGEAPPGLFAEPFGPAYVDGFRARARLTIEKPVDETSYRPIVGWVATSVAVLCGAVAVWQGVRAGQEYEDYRATNSAVIKAQREASVRSHRGRATGFGVAAGVAASAAVGVFVWDFVD